MWNILWSSFVWRRNSSKIGLLRTFKQGLSVWVSEVILLIFQRWTLAPGLNWSFCRVSEASEIYKFTIAESAPLSQSIWRTAFWIWTDFFRQSSMVKDLGQSCQTSQKNTGRKGKNRLLPCKYKQVWVDEHAHVLARDLARRPQKHFCS